MPAGQLLWNLKARPSPVSAQTRICSTLSRRVVISRPPHHKRVDYAPGVVAADNLSISVAWVARVPVAGVGGGG